MCTVEGVCSRLIVDYLCGTCEVNGKGFYASLSIIVIKDREAREKNSFVKGLYRHRTGTFSNINQCANGDQST